MAKSNKIRKFLIIFMLIILILGAGVGAGLWHASYSDGSRTGRIIKLSNKGIFFKTWEGELNMESLGHSKSTAGLSTVWAFSVDDSNKEVLRQLDSAMINSLRVQLLYSEKYIKIKLRGETKYFITEVKFTDPPNVSQENSIEKQLTSGLSDTTQAVDQDTSSALPQNIAQSTPDAPPSNDAPEESSVYARMANFEIENNGCYAPCEIQFQNLSPNAVAYFWDFGDGDKSDERAPSHTFLTAGNYEVKLKAIRKDGSKTQKSKWVVIR